MAEGGSTALYELLTSAKLSDIVPDQQDVVILEHNLTVGEALKTLAKRKILSAPIMISPGLEDVESLIPDDSGPSLLGWLDVVDLIKALIQYLSEQQSPLPRSMLALMTELEKHGPRFADKTLITILGSDDRGLVYQADADMPLIKLIRELFLGPNGSRVGVHRVALFDSHGDITAVVSQMDVLKYLLRHEGALGPLGGRSCEEVGWCGGQALVSLDPATPTLLAFDQLAAARVLGGPVVAHDGQLIANLSISDVRCIQPAHFGVLALPVAEFLALSHGTSYLGYSQRTSSSAEHPFFAAAAGAGAGAGGGPLGRAGSGVPRGAMSPPRTSPRRPPPAAAGGGGEEGALGRVGSMGVGGGGGGVVEGVGVEEAAGPGAAAEVADVLEGEGQEEQEEEEEGVRRICVEKRATLAEVLKLMVRRHVHRVYVVQPGAKPCEVVGIVTPTDILKAVSEGIQATGGSTERVENCATAAAATAGAEGMAGKGASGVDGVDAAAAKRAKVA